MRNIIPVLTVVGLLIVVWYGAAVALNAQWARDVAARADKTLTFSELVADTWSQDKPKLPAPHQVGAELWETTVMKKIHRKDLRHGFINTDRKDGKLNGSQLVHYPRSVHRKPGKKYSTCMLMYQEALTLTN